MAGNLLENDSFEADWAEEESHRCLVFLSDGEPHEVERGNIFTPPHWLTWFRHDPGTWDQPEVRDAWVTGDPVRVHSGQKSILLFTFFRKHDGGFLQQVEVEPGTRLRLTAWAHAWSNWQDSPHEDDPRWSDGEGVGYNHFFGLEGEVEDDGARNFTFRLGIDPTGGTDPFADTVVWGRGAHIYNAYRPVPPVEVVAQSDTVTVFLRSRTLWAFKHNDAYWDDARLEVVTSPPRTEIAFEPAKPQAEETVQVTVTSTKAYEEVSLQVADPTGETVPVTEVPVEPPSEGGQWCWTFVPSGGGTYHVTFGVAEGDQRLAEADLAVQPGPTEAWGLPREQYARTYVLLPPGAGPEWVDAILDSGAWERHRWTIGASADDAGIGALEDKRVIAVNPEAWPSDLADFFRRYYPRTRYVPLEVTTPEELRRELEEMD
ncbi:MAG: hypothetical protein PVH62_04485 [Anaerolineae bacterium]